MDALQISSWRLIKYLSIYLIGFRIVRGGSRISLGGSIQLWDGSRIVHHGPRWFYAVLGRFLRVRGGSKIVLVDSMQFYDWLSL